MHRITHLVLSLALVAAVATGMIVIPHHAAAASLVPFHATMNETFMFQSTNVRPQHDLLSRHGQRSKPPTSGRPAKPARSLWTS